jgi:signal transduction histidine kinase
MMPIDLRTRLIISYPFLGAMVGLLLAGLLIFSLEAMEREFMDSFLGDELQQFMDRQDNPAEAHFGHMSAYYTAPDQAPPGFAMLAAMAPGNHEFSHQGREYDVAIGERQDGRYYLIFDDTEIEQRQTFLEILLIGGFLLAVFASTWLGYFISARVIQPIRELARRVLSAGPTAEHKPVASEFADDEVGDLAEAFDAYHQRLMEFVSREREFTADASHELRSPLAVIRATAEGMLANEALPEQFRAKVERLVRASEGMTEILDVLLWLSREAADHQPGVDSSTDLALELERLVAIRRESLEHRPLELELVIDAKPVLEVPPASVVMVMDNLLRNALAYTPEGLIRVVLEESRLLVEDNGTGVSAEDQQRIFTRGERGERLKAPGKGLGLAIALRLCEHFGWQLTLSPRPGGGTVAQWTFK